MSCTSLVVKQNNESVLNFVVMHLMINRLLFKVLNEQDKNLAELGWVGLNLL